MTREEVVTLLKPIIVGKILHIEKHPNADRLLLADLDLGTPLDELRSHDEALVLQENGHYYKRVITGAPNIKEGDYVPYLGLGNIVPGYLIMKNEKVTLEKRLLRGLESTAMVLAADEIGLSNDHTGIMLVNELSNSDLTTTDFYSMVGKSLVDFMSEDMITKIMHNVCNADTVPQLQ